MTSVRAITEIESVKPRSHAVTALDKLPAWIKQDHPAFAQMLQAYYQWLDMRLTTVEIEEDDPQFVKGEVIMQDGVPVGQVTDQRPNNVEITQQIDGLAVDNGSVIIGSISGAIGTPFRYSQLKNTRALVSDIEEMTNLTYVIDEFFDYIRAEILPDVPDNTLIDRQVLARYIRDFYNAKGSFDSIRLLFRILFNQDVGIDYPARRLFRTSTAAWSGTELAQSLQVTGEDTLFDLVNQRFMGETGTIEHTGFTTPLEADEIVKVTDLQGMHAADVTVDVPDIDSNTFSYKKIVREKGRDVRRGYSVAGQTSGASANVNDISPRPVQGIIENIIKKRGVFEFTISGTTRNIIPGTILRAQDETSQESEFTVTTVVNDYNIINPGKGNIPGTTYTLTNPDGLDGSIRVTDIVEGNIIRVSAPFEIDQDVVLTGRSAGAFDSTGYRFGTVTAYDVRRWAYDGFQDVDFAYHIPIRFDNIEAGFDFSRELHELIFDDVNLDQVPALSPIKNTAGRMPIINQTDQDGQVTGMAVISPGSQWTAPPTIALEGGGEVQTILGSSFSETAYENAIGFPSSGTAIIQGADRYQPFSYTLQAGIPVRMYEPIIRKLVHPAGMYMDGQVVFLPTTISAYANAVQWTTSWQHLRYWIIPDGTYGDLIPAEADHWYNIKHELRPDGILGDIVFEAEEYRYNVRTWTYPEQTEGEDTFVEYAGDRKRVETRIYPGMLGQSYYHSTTLEDRDMESIDTQTIDYAFGGSLPPMVIYSSQNVTSTVLGMTVDDDVAV